jgi:hypothetical protein
MAKVTETLMNLGSHIEASPATVFTLHAEMIEEAYGGSYDIVDATNPMVSLLEATATSAAAGIMRAEKLHRREFPILAQTKEDLFPHMASVDHIKRFAAPARDVVIRVAISAEEIRNNAVEDTTYGMSRITVPADSVYTVNGIRFYQGIPIDILVMDDGQITAQWDNTYDSPFRETTRNQVNTKIGWINGTESFVMDFDVLQLGISTATYPVSVASGFIQTVSYEDQYHHCRIYYYNENNQWVEMETTYDERIHDPNSPTAQIRVVDNIVTVRIPEIYITKEMVGTKIRIDLYSTRGEISVDLNDFDTDSWSVQFEDLDNPENEFVTPLFDLSNIQIVSTATTTGGQDEMNFEELRDLVLYGLYGKDKPITFPELKTHLAKEDMGIERQKDNISELVYVATKKLSIPEKENLSTGSGTAAEPVEIALSRQDVEGQIKINQPLSTIKPSGLYVREDGVVRLLSDQELVGFEALDSYAKAEEMNNKEYFYTPFHYVIDETTTDYELRAYDLDSSRVDLINAVAVNNTLGFTVKTQTAELTYLEPSNTYRLVLETETPGNGDSIRAVLNYKDPVTGEMFDLVADPEIINTTTTRYTFDLVSLLDIDIDNKFTLDSMFGQVTDQVKIPLHETQFDLAYVLDGTEASSSLDTVLARVSLEGQYTTVSHERLDLNFGKLLDRLYSGIRKIITPPRYKLHTSDVPATWPETKYKENELGKIPIYNPDGSIDFEIEYNQGDPIYDSEGNQEFLYKKGDLVIDPITQKAVLDSPGGTAFICRLILLDAKFRYADTTIVSEYAKQIPSMIDDVLEGRIKQLAQDVDDDVHLFFEPVSDNIRSRVRLDSSKEAYIKTALEFDIAIRLSDSAYESPSIRDSIKQSAKLIIQEELKERDFILSRLYARFDRLSSANVRGVEIDSPIPGANMAILLESNASFTLASKALVLSNGQIDVVDAINIEFTQ